MVYEGDRTRQGTASTKTRWEVSGSHKKLYAQKGTGRARVGDKQSPLRRGGGKTFGPHPRDFATRLPRKVYDLAWRTALSYRYRRGELVVCQDGMELPLPAEFERLVAEGRFSGRWQQPLGGEEEDGGEEGLGPGGPELRRAFRARWTCQVLDTNGWGRAAGRSTFVTVDHRTNLFRSLDLLPRYGVALAVDDVDVKDLLETGRIVVERAALKEMIARHQSDLVTSVSAAVGALPRSRPPESGEVLVE